MLILGLVALVAGLATIDGTSSMRTSSKLNVHLVCHTHDDPGWLKTVDQYHYGANNTIIHAGVQYILDSVVKALEEDPARTFVYAEQAFMWRWWRHQGPHKRDLVRRLVSESRLSFVNGGWVMHDEATAHYVGMIDQTHLGHAFLRREFGEEALPRVAWQIDPFGHSVTQASLLGAQAGFEALYFGRIDYQDREKRIAASDMEMIWRGSRSLEEKAQIFTGVFHSGNYGPPVGFCFDQACQDEPIMNDPIMADYNAERRASEFADACEEMARNTRGNDIMLQMGGDFGFENANAWFKNLDALIDTVNREGRVNVFYSTPELYTEEKHATELEWSVKKDDFFPYADCPNCYWTGFYTSRPGLKRLERVTSGYLQAARQLQALAGWGKGEDVALSWRALRDFERAQALTQHHDAITGTSKQHVADDYAQRLDRAWVDVEAAVSASLSRQAFGWEVGRQEFEGEFPRLSQCRLSNVSVCDFTMEAEEAFVAVVYNPLAQQRLGFIDVPISWSEVCVTDGDGNMIESQVLPFRHHNLITRGKGSSDGQRRHPYTLVVPVEKVRPFSVGVFHVSRGEGRPGLRFRRTWPEPEESVKHKEPWHVTQPELEEHVERRESTPDVVMDDKKEARDGTGSRLETPLLEIGRNLRANIDGGSSSSDNRVETNFTISNDLVTLTFDGAKGRLSRMELHGGVDGEGEGSSLDVNQGWFFYPSFDRGGKPSEAEASTRLHQEVPERLEDSEEQRGGAYIFRPEMEGNESRGIPVGSMSSGGREERGLWVKEWWVEEGPLVSEVHQVFSNWVTQTIRLRRGAAYAEFDWSVGPIPVGGNASGSAGKEVISRFSAPSLATAGVFYTDANGREFQRRLRDRRPTWDLNLTEPVAGNYYPATAAAFIKDEEERGEDGLQLSVLTDRAQGCSSLADGELELLVHRRLLTEDQRGVGEALNETNGGMSHYPDWKRDGEGEVFRGTHYLVISKKKEGMKDVRTLMDEVFSPFVVAFGEKDADIKSPLPPPLIGDVISTDECSVVGRSLRGQRLSLFHPLPENVGLMTLMVSEEDRGSMGGGSEAGVPDNFSLLVRLTHRYAEGEHELLSVPATFFLPNIVFGHSLVHVEEIALTGGAPLAARGQRLEWNTADVPEGARDDVRSSRDRERVFWEFDRSSEAWEVSSRDVEKVLEMDMATSRQHSLSWQVTIGPMEIKTFRLEFKTLS